ncbi:MAG: hypothetical protein ACI89X_003089 [Planctomycetota bacterium]|jgi:hypothetical protein
MPMSATQLVLQSPLHSAAWLRASLGAACLWLTPLTAQEPVEFARDVRPILSDRCFICHGPDAAKREAGLRLDMRDVAVKKMASGRAAIVPGDSSQSELLRRLTAHDPDERMPPAASKLTVSPAEVEVLRRWINEGAAYALHWSFAPLPEVVELPKVRQSDWVKNGIDAFVLAGLEREGVAPSPPATPAAYLRRASLVLNGLPPTIEQVDRFIADGDSVRAIGELLQSKRYGERMASDWLDIARYADTFGYQSDVERPVWPWRDWVIDSFNANLPYDKFATWQIAGDLLPDATREQQLATAFQRLHRQTNEGGSVEAEMRLEYVADRTETFATAFLGLTVGCARCHDHKFDPVTQREYYELSAFFDNIDESGLYSHFTQATPTPALSLATDKQSMAESKAAARVAALEEDIEALTSSPREAEAFAAAGTDAHYAGTRAPEHGHAGTFAFESLVKGVLVNAKDAALPGRIGDNPVLVDGVVGKAIQFKGENWAKFPKVGNFDRHQPFSLAFWLRVSEQYDRAVVMHRSKAWTDAGSRGYELLIEDGELSFALVHFWPGNAIRIRAHQKLPVDAWTHVTLAYDGSSRAHGMTIFVDGEVAATRVIRDGLTRTIQGGGADALTLAQRFRDRGLKGGAIDELQVFRRELTRGEAARLSGRGDPATREEELQFYFRAVHTDYRKRLEELRQARLQLGQTRDKQAEIMVMREMATRRATYVRPRGSYLAQGEQVNRGTPACLPKSDAKDRLALARWLTDPAHPLAARVAVNRIWQLHFGTGLVGTAEDFGSQGAPPSHPRLLDWLARWFVNSGWDVKALHRLIATSATFGQNSLATEELRERDPENRLLARGPRYQLSAEVLRDQALWAAGLLVERIGGRPVRPYQPAGLWKEKSGRVYHRAKDDGLYRRSLYTYWKRTSPPPAMMLLDASKRDVCVMRRQSTTTPLQALLMLNDPQFVEPARVWAERLVAAPGKQQEQLAEVFRRLTSRVVTARELEILTAALREQREAYRLDPKRAQQTATIGDRKPAADVDVVEVAAWTMVISMLMNFDEVVRMR